MTSPDKMEFPKMCRDLRLQSRLKQREVAVHVGLSPKAYANVESNNHKTMRLERVQKLAKLYQLDEASTATLVAAWEALPASEYNQRNAKPWAERQAAQAVRGKAKNHDRLQIALLELATLFITSVDDPDSLCTCDFGEGRACELCTALQVLGLRGYTTREEVISGLAALQEKVDAQ